MTEIKLPPYIELLSNEDAAQLLAEIKRLNDAVEEWQQKIVDQLIIWNKEYNDRLQRHSDNETL